MSVRRVCDRSGKDIEGSKDPNQAGPDLVIEVPWCGEFARFEFQDLSDEQRMKVLDYVLTITQNSGKADRARVQRSCLSFRGGPLYPEAPAEESTPVATPVVVLDTSFEISPRGLEGLAGNLSVGEKVVATYPDGTPCVYQRHAQGWIEVGPPEAMGG